MIAIDLVVFDDFPNFSILFVVVSIFQIGTVFGNFRERFKNKVEGQRLQEVHFLREFRLDK